MRGQRALERYLRSTRQEPSIKDVAFDVMADAYQKASGNGRYPAHARQIMYQARPLILAGTDKPLGKDFDQYFTQTLLPAYRRRHRDTTTTWDVVYDASGHFEEPHTARVVSLGTLDVRAYLASARNGSPGDGATITPISLRYPTTGPQGRYRDVLFLEKEGFNDLLDAARIAQRFDLAIMSTKGYSSTAARTLMECLPGVRFLVLHDFDKDGFGIVHTLRYDTTRYQFWRRPEVIDLGLRLADVEVEGLAAEPVSYGRSVRRAPAAVRYDGARDRVPSGSPCGAQCLHIRPFRRVVGAKAPGASRDQAGPGRSHAGSGLPPCRGAPPCERGADESRTSGAGRG